MKTESRTTEAIPILPLALAAEEISAINTILGKPTHFIDSPEFHKPNPHVRLFPPDFKVDTAQVEASWTLFGEAGQPGDFKVRRLSKPEEQVLFLQYNYARYVVFRLRKKRELSICEARKLLRWQRISDDVRNTIWVVNLPLVISVAKAKHYTTRSDFADDLFPAGQDGLRKAIYYFDVGRGYAFSTYAYRAITTNYWRAINDSRDEGYFNEYHPGEEKIRRKIYSFEDLGVELGDGTERSFEPMDETYWRQFHDEEERKFMWATVKESLKYLPPIQQSIIKHRLGLSEAARGAGKSLSLREVGEMLDISNERVRQIQEEAIRRLQKGIGLKRLLCGVTSG